MWGERHEEYQQAYTDGEPNEAKFSHELIAGAASFAGFKAFEDHQRNEGKTVKHQFAKELLAGFAGAEVDKLVETKGMDEYDRERAKHRAREHTEQMYDEHYGNRDEYNPQYQPHERLRQEYGNDRW